MNAGLAAFILLIVAMVMVTAIVTAALQSRARPKEEGADGRREIELLSEENAKLRGQIGRLEERLAVMERIVTDPAQRTASEIEDLR